MPELTCNPEGDQMKHGASCRVLIVITGLKIGGAEHFLQRLVDGFSPAIRPLVVSLSGLGPVADMIRASGGRVESVGEQGRLSVRSLVCLFRLMRDYRPDIVFTWLYHGCLIGSVIARLAGVRRIVWNVRNTVIPRGAVRWRTTLVSRMCVPLSRVLPCLIVCCSERAAAAHQQLGYPAKRFVVIPNGFDTERFSPVDGARSAVCRQLGIDPEYPLIGRVGRDDPQKDNDNFLRCCAMLAVRYPTARFLMAGQGMDSTNRSLCERIEQLNLQDQVLLLGQRTDDVPQLMSALDVMVSSSLAEGFPNVIGEAMACAVPCAVTDVGDSALIVGPCGEVVPPGAPEALADAVSKILSLAGTERLELGARARERIVSEFGLAKSVARYEDELLRSLAL